MEIQSGEFTINGNGYRVRPGGPYLNIRIRGGVLNLNNVVIWNGGGFGGASHFINIDGGGTLNVRNSEFHGNVYQGVIKVGGGNTRVNLENVKFVWNRAPSTTPAENSAIAMLIWGDDAVVTLDGATFEDNGGHPNLIRVRAGTLRLRGRIKYNRNFDSLSALQEPVGNPPTPVSLYVPAATFDDTGAIYWSPYSRKRREDPSPTPSPTARPLATTCIDLNLATGIVVHATYGLSSGVQCQRLGGGGIGVQALADNYIDAVDVWGYVEQGVEVCFPQAGELLFLDARTIPRAVAPLASTVVNGMTCGAIDSPGSIVLMPLP